MFNLNQEKKPVAVSRATELTKVALVTALYVAITFTLSVISFGSLQLRLSEMFNYLPLFNKRYIWAVTIGVAVANMNSPLGIMDVLIGSISTFLVLKLVQGITEHMKNTHVKFIITAFVFAFSMFTVAGQLTIFYQLPFFVTWLSVGLGELFSMTMGGLVIYGISKKVDLTK